MTPGPTLKTARRMLDRYMPELVPTWERLVELADGDEMTARFLTQWNPPTVPTRLLASRTHRRHADSRAQLRLPPGPL